MIAPTTAVGSLFLLVQAIVVLCSPFLPVKYLGWGMYNSITSYTIEARMDGRALSEDAVRARYGRSAGLEKRAITHLFGELRQYEATYGTGDDVQLVVRYRTNGGPARTWRHPDPR